MKPDSFPIGSIAKVPVRGRLKLLRESMRYVPPEEGDSFRYRDILFFLRFLIPLKGPIIASLILSFIISISSTIMPLSSKWVIDYLFLGQSTAPLLGKIEAHNLGFLVPYADLVLHSLPLVICTLAVVEIIKYVLSNERSLIQYRINTEFTYRVRMTVFHQVLRYPLSYFKSSRTGYLLARISGDTSGLSAISGSILQGIISNATTLIVTSTILFSLSQTLTLIVLVFVPISVGLSYWINRISRSYNIRGREIGLRTSADGQEILSAIDTIKIHASEHRELDKYANNLQKSISLTIASMLFGQVTGGIQRSISYALTLIVMLIGGTLVIEKLMSIGDYTAFLAMYPQLTGAVSMFLQLPLSLQGTAIASGRVKELLDLTTEDESPDPKHPLIVPDHPTRGEIVCDNVSFSYDSDVPVLSDCSLYIAPGEHIVLTGQTGAGKSTFIHLLLKLYQPDSGNIFLDGMNIRDLHPRWIREQMAVVSQDLFLFHDTIMNNVRYSRPDASDDEVMQACRSAGLHDEIMTFPEGYDLIVGERGGKLSGGQKQRLAIARALLRNAPIFILDEPTAHLDPETEKRLTDEFMRLLAGRTVIIISHREDLTRLADRVYHMKQGKIHVLSM
ncbi:MAG: putative ABC transporter ATP-binding protein [Euryarchaeota archaeon ADurb.Bin165]|nr:MAG: putative ABC transporter ATP-binding protein [Euryarchaeota archaeon ADurb.Bin165]